MRKIIHFYTKEGQPVWRYETAEEVLLNELNKREKEKVKEFWLDKEAMCQHND